jgi:hypothetical protein
LGAALAAVALVVLSAAPAMADAETGTKNCAGIGTISVRSYSTGTVRHYVDQYDWEYTAVNGSTWTVRYNYEPDVNNTWRVTTDGLLNFPGTYAYCSGV